MASFSEQLLLLFIIIFLCKASKFHARESQFFGKTLRHHPPEAANQEATATSTEYPQQSQNGYGLYGRDPDQLQPTATTTSDSYYGTGAENYGKDSNVGHQNSYYNNDDARYRMRDQPYHYDTYYYDSNAGNSHKGLDHPNKVNNGYGGYNTGVKDNENVYYTENHYDDDEYVP